MRCSISALKSRCRVIRWWGQAGRALGHRNQTRPLGAPEKGFFTACVDVKPDKRFVVNSGMECYPVGEGVEAIGLKELAAMLAAL